MNNSLHATILLCVQELQPKSVGSMRLDPFDYIHLRKGQSEEEAVNADSPLFSNTRIESKLPG